MYDNKSHESRERPVSLIIVVVVISGASLAAKVGLSRHMIAHAFDDRQKRRGGEKEK